MQVTFDGGLAVAAVGGDRAGQAPSAPVDAFDRGRELRPVGGGAVFNGVVEDDAVVVVSDLGLVAELDRAVDAPFADRPGVGVVQADQAGCAFGVCPASRVRVWATIRRVRSIVTTSSRSAR